MALTKISLSDAGVTGKTVEGNLSTSAFTNDAVTLAKIQNVAANSLIGRNANSSGDLSEVALTDTQILIGDGTGFTAAALSGDITMANTGAVTLTSESVQDIAGAMFTSNTETGITATYQDGDGTIDLVVGTLNQDTTGSAATLTTARTIHGVSFDGSANIDLSEVVADTVGAMFSSNTET